MALTLNLTITNHAKQKTSSLSNESFSAAARDIVKASKMTPEEIKLRIGTAHTSCTMDEASMAVIDGIAKEIGEHPGKVLRAILEGNADRM